MTRARMAGMRWPAVFVWLAVASSVAVALCGARVVKTGDIGLAFLVWNLLLAWVPFALAIIIYGGYRHGFPRAVLVLLGIAWLLFLPNAPYIATDFVHLSRDSGVPLWYDAIMIGVSAATGVLLGFASLYLIQAVAVHRLGREFAWPFVMTVLALTSVGIYLGRVHRLNSWDAVGRPRLLIELLRERLLDPFANESLLVILPAVTFALGFSYLLFCLLLVPRTRLRRVPRLHWH